MEGQNMNASSSPCDDTGLTNPGNQQSKLEIDVIYKLNDAQIQQLTDLYQQQWWSKGRQLEDVTKMLEGCLSTALIERSSSRLVGYVRILTDYVYKAIVFDVMVDEAHHGKGLGRRLLNALVLEHPHLKTVNHFELYCLPDMVPFYEKWGFSNETFSTLNLVTMRRKKFKDGY